MKVQLSSSFLLAATVVAHEGHHHHRHGDMMHHGHHHHFDEHEHGHGHGHQGDHNELMPQTHIAYHHVEGACGDDVKTLCSDDGKNNEVSAMRQLPGSFEDPFLDWVFLPHAPVPPEMDCISRMMDEMVMTLFQAPPATFTSFIIVDSVQQHPHMLVDSMAAKMAAEQEPEEVPQLVETLRMHGNELMHMHEEGSFHHGMARRLSEVDAATIQQHVHLPFGCAKNKCLLDAFAAKKVSSQCAHAIEQLETTFQMEEELDRRQNLFLGMMWVYMGLVVIMMVMVGHRMRSQRGKRRLKIRIMQAIYSNPSLKKDVEEQLGESIGSVPPLMPAALGLMNGGGQELRRRIQCMKRAHFAFCVVLLALVFIAPMWVLPLCILASVVRIVRICCTSHANEEECECCCCGASTTNAANGALTAEQECCGCCKGTGVCAPSCADCCGGDGCCCCCGCTDGSCSCCGDDATCKYTPLKDCCCCCCAATPEMAKAGQLTAAQECCTCCKGTGCCSDACAACCGGGGSCAAPPKKGRGQKHVFTAKQTLHEGVPIQLV